MDLSLLCFYCYLYVALWIVIFFEWFVIIHLTKCLVNNLNSYDLDAFVSVFTFNYTYYFSIGKPVLLLGLCHAVPVEEEPVGGVAGGVLFCHLH